MKLFFPNDATHAEKAEVLANWALLSAFVSITCASVAVGLRVFG